MQVAVNPDGSPSGKVNPSGMGNGAAQFAEGLDIRLATPATAVDLTAADQGLLMARAVIVTAPVTVLAAGKITSTPDLPMAYQQAFADLPFGLVDKLGVAFSTDIFGETPANTVITRHRDADLDAFAMALARLADTPMMNLFFAVDLARYLAAAGSVTHEALAREFLTHSGSGEAAPDRSTLSRDLGRSRGRRAGRGSSRRPRGWFNIHTKRVRSSCLCSSQTALTACDGCIEASPRQWQEWIGNSPDVQHAAHGQVAA